MSQYVVLAVAALVVLWFVASYNGLVVARNRVRNAWSQIDVQLKRRHDLVPNLVNAVKGYMAHERGALQDVLEARQAAMGARGAGAASRAEGELSGALGRLFALAEAYPNLRASENFSLLQEELSATENRIGFARQHYNDSVMELNTRIESLPTSIVAGLGGFRIADFFEIQNAGEREVPRVDFDGRGPIARKLDAPV